jgi:hypothetical protein
MTSLEKDIEKCKTNIDFCLKVCQIFASMFVGFAIILYSMPSQMLSIVSDMLKLYPIENFTVSQKEDAIKIISESLKSFINIDLIGIITVLLSALTVLFLLIAFLNLAALRRLQNR